MVHTSSACSYRTCPLILLPLNDTRLDSLRLPPILQKLYLLLRRHALSRVMSPSSQRLYHNGGSLSRVALSCRINIPVSTDIGIVHGVANMDSLLIMTCVLPNITREGASYLGLQDLVLLSV